MKTLLFALVLAMPAVAAPPDGVRTVDASRDVPATVERLRAEIAARDLTVLATIDHGAGAARVEQQLRPTVLLLFGSPKAGTPVMQRAQLAGLDLPLRVLVHEDEDGKTRISFVDPAWIAERHGATEVPSVSKMSAAITAIVEAAR
jgi:uncharacterized protein (DUF302 family)